MLIRLAPLRRYRDFRLLFVGQMVSFFGSMITYVAIPYQVYELTGSSFMVGLLSSVQLVPVLVFALWGGAYADALDRRKLLIVSELILVLATLALIVNSLMATPSLALIFTVSALMSAVNGFHRPAMEAMTPKLVSREDLPAAVALGSVRHTVGAIAGPALGGVCIARLGLAGTYLIDAVTFVVSLAALAAMRSMPADPDATQPGIKAIAEGLRYARSRPELIGTYVVDIVAMTFAMPMALFPALAQPWGGADAAGWLYSAMSIGPLAVTLFSGWTSNVSRHGAAVVLAAAGWGIAIVGLGFAPNLWAAVACLALAGAADMVSGLFRQTIWNETIPSRLRGRLAGVEMISYLTGPLLGNMRAGYVASVSTNAVSIVSGGVICTLGVLLCIPLLPAFWKYRRAPYLASQDGN